MEGALYEFPTSRSRDIDKGDVEIQAEQADQTTCWVNVTVELLDPGKTVTGVECYSFPYEFVEDRWVFTDFDLVY